MSELNRSSVEPNLAVKVLLVGMASGITPKKKTLRKLTHWDVEIRDRINGKFLCAHCIKGILTLTNLDDAHFRVKCIDYVLAPKGGGAVAVVSTVEHIWTTSGAHQRLVAPETAMRTCYF